MPYIPPQYEAAIPAAIHSGEPETTPVLIVGAGPVGLAAALDLGLRGHHVIIIDQDTQLSDGSRAICYAKRPLEILDRLGIGERMLKKGVSWNIGRVFFQDRKEPIYSFDLLPVKNQKFPAMVNLQQYYNEEYNVEALRALENVNLRWGNTVTAVEAVDDGVTATIETAEGAYRINADWLIACDGSHSCIRKLMGVKFEGETFQDNFLIADVKFRKDYATERHFWFDPPFNPGQSALLHKQPDDVWRIDFQLGWDIDRDEVVKPENVTPRIKAMFGDDIEFDYEWISVYTFNCRQVDSMTAGRVIFAGDAAHLVSPFGARGANTGFQDADNLAWKLDLIINGVANENLLRSYNEERLLAAKENIKCSTRSTDFITPKSDVSRTIRDATLELSSEHEFTRGFVNSGRLSTPVPYPESLLNTPDEDIWSGGIAPGANCLDAPVITKNGARGWLLNHLGWTFKLMIFYENGEVDPGLHLLLETANKEIAPTDLLIVSQQDSRNEYCVLDVNGITAERYDASPGACYLVRPDQYVAARWKVLDSKKILTALKRAIAKM